MEQYKLSEFEILSIVEEAVRFGSDALNGQKIAMALQIASFWLEGYIEGRKNCITEYDVKSLRQTMKNYFFL